MIQLVRFRGQTCIIPRSAVPRRLLCVQTPLRFERFCDIVSVRTIAVTSHYQRWSEVFLIATSRCASGAAGTQSGMTKAGILSACSQLLRNEIGSNRFA
jgi:hypothetical protein